MLLATCRLLLAAFAVERCQLLVAPTGSRYSNYFQATLITHKSLAGTGQAIDATATASMRAAHEAGGKETAGRDREGKRRGREKRDVKKEGSLFCQRHFPAIGLPLEAAAVAAVVVASVAVAVASGQWPQDVAAAACVQHPFTQHAKHLCDIYSKL